MDTNRPWKGIATAEEIAERLKLGRSTVYDLVRDRRIPYFRVGRSIRFDLEVVYEWMLGQMGVEDDEYQGGGL